MTNAYNINISTDEATPEQVAAWRQQLENSQPTAPMIQGQHSVASRHEVTFQGGQITHESASAKTEQSVYVTPTKPGFVTIGGTETSVEAAKAAGFLPHYWVEGQPLPFDNPSASQSAMTAGGNNSQTTKANTVEGNGPSDAQETPEVAHAQHLAKLAGDILDGVDKTHGSGVADALLEQVADSGDIDSIMSQLPAGVTGAQAQQVMAGYMASADHAFKAGGSSLTAVTELLDDNELRDARRYTLSGNKQALADLGRVAVDRLAQLPERDPQAFAEMVEAMPPKDRAMIAKNKRGSGWVLKAPGVPEMTFGAAVRMGFIRL